MSDPKITIENDESERQVVEIGGLPKKVTDVIPTGKKFNFRRESENESSDGSVVSMKSDKSVKSEKTKSQRPRVSDNFDFGIYADPKKTKSKTVESDADDDEEEEYTEDSEADEDDYSEDSEGDEADNQEETFSQPDSEPRRRSQTPGMSQAQLRIKKKELLLKLHDAEQNGYQITGKYNMNSDLEDLEAEYSLYEKRMEQNAMVDLLQDGLMFIIKGIEMFNGFYKPMGVNLTGLSDKIYDRREQLEHVLKRLAIKYSGGTEMPPELSLLFIIGGAMVMTHIGNTALSSGGIEKLLGGLGSALNSGKSENGAERGSNGNPLAGLMSGLMSNLGKMNQPQPSNQPTMTPPSLDINSILSGMRNVDTKKPTKPIDSKEDPFNKVGGRQDLPFSATSVPAPQPFPKMTRDRDIGRPGTTAKMPDQSDRFSVSSVSSGDETVETMNITVPSSRKGRKGRKTVKKNVFHI